MNRTRFGILLGILLSVIIFLSNVVFPSNAPDWAPGELFVAILIGLYVMWAAYRSDGSLKERLLTGALTSLIGFTLAMATFFIIDNAYLGIVSQQSDKIVGFRAGHYTSMQAYINMNLVKALLFGLPASTIFGLVCGWAAHHVPPAFSRKTVRS